MEMDTIPFETMIFLLGYEKAKEDEIILTRVELAAIDAVRLFSPKTARLEQ
jgi:hypothetical protein